MVDIYVTVSGHGELNRKLSALASKLRDRAIPNRAIATQLYAWTIDNFDSAGRLVGGWAPLAPATIAEKKRIGKEQPLVRTGALRASLLPFSDNDRVGIGTPLAYARPLHEGATSRRLPARPIIPGPDVITQMGIKVYEFYISQTKQAVGL